MKKKRSEKKIISSLVLVFFAIFFITIGVYFYNPGILLSPGEGSIIIGKWLMSLFVLALLVILTIVSLIVYFMTH